MLIRSLFLITDGSLERILFEFENSHAKSCLRGPTVVRLPIDGTHQTKQR